MPRGRMVEPENADYWVSWQDAADPEDDVVHGAAAAVAWGRKRSSVVMIRLGHSQGTYFSAGDEHPADRDDAEEHVPHWPATEPRDGWWCPPPVPSLAEVEQMVARVAGGDVARSDAAEWADERLQLFSTALDIATQRKLVELLEQTRS